MKQTDILGQALPVLEVRGFRAFPPPLYLLKRDLPLIRRYVDGLIAKDFSAVSAKAAAKALQELFGTRLDNISASDFLDIVTRYLVFVSETLPSLPYCAVPEVHADEDDDEIGFRSFTSEEKLVADYANIGIPEVNDLNYVDYLILRREAVIYMFSRTKKGRELLYSAYCAEQTEPDRAALRARFGGEKRGKE